MERAISKMPSSPYWSFLRKHYVRTLPETRFNSAAAEYTFYKRAAAFKRPVLKVKLFCGATGGFRSPLVSIRREFIVAIPMVHDREKGADTIVCRYVRIEKRGGGEEAPLGTQQVREMPFLFSRYPFVSLELGQSWPPRRPLSRFAVSSFLISFTFVRYISASETSLIALDYRLDARGNWSHLIPKSAVFWRDPSTHKSVNKRHIGRYS